MNDYTLLINFKATLFREVRSKKEAPFSITLFSIEHHVSQRVKCPVLFLIFRIFTPGAVCVHFPSNFK